MKKFLSTLTILLGISLTSFNLSSCTNYIESNLSKELTQYYTNWYNSLTNSEWNFDFQKNEYIDYSTKSEQQAIGLYSWCSGSFWNEFLHKKQNPNNDIYALKNTKLNFNPLKPKMIFGDDYKYMTSALNKATSPNYDFYAYHGVEYAEIEFYEQLKQYIKIINNEYNYDDCIGKIIQSYGFISSTLRQEYADNFFDWRPHYNNYDKALPSNPLKEPVLFKIKIPANTLGVAYLSNFDFAGFGNKSTEEQILINLNMYYKIINVSKIYNSKNKKINLFEVDLINI